MVGSVVEQLFSFLLSFFVSCYLVSMFLLILIRTRLVQPLNSSATMTVTNTTIIFLSPAQPNLRRIRESIGEFGIKLVARRRSDGLTSRTFNFKYVEHNERCDHLVDSEDGIARIEKKTRARPNNKKRRMFKNDESSVGQSITESE